METFTAGVWEVCMVTFWCNCANNQVGPLEVPVHARIWNYSLVLNLGIKLLITWGMVSLHHHWRDFGLPGKKPPFEALKGSNV